MKRFLSVLTVISILGSATPAFAAPTVAFKKQLVLPRIDASVLQRVSGMTWNVSYIPDASSGVSKVANLRNVPLKTPWIIDELECGDTSYKLWWTPLDTPKVLQNLKKLSAPPAESFVEAPLEARYVFEARRGGKTKWHISTEGRTPLTNYGALGNALFGCANRDAVIQRSGYNPRNTIGTDIFKRISFDAFDVDSAWSGETASRSYLSVGVGSDVIADGVRQNTGLLTTLYGASREGSRIFGDSRIFVADARGFSIHNVPRYRDLSFLNTDTSVDLRAEFYRLSDGYGVKEMAGCNNACGIPAERTYYRIRDGEASYSRVESLPRPIRGMMYVDLPGVVYQDIEQAIGFRNPSRLLVHGLPSGSDFHGAILWETFERMYTRYTVKSPSGPQQYWEATIQK